MPLILLLTMIAIFFYYNAQENIKGFYKTRGFSRKGANNWYRMGR